MLDLEVYRYGGRAALDGLPLYGGRDPVTDLPFTYPPVAALLMAPLAVLPGVVASSLWTVLSVGALVAVVGIAVGEVGRRVRGPGPRDPASSGLGRSAARRRSVVARFFGRGAGASSRNRPEGAGSRDPGWACRPSSAAAVVGVAAACVVLEPVWLTLAFGQVNLLLMLLVVVDLLVPDRRWAGVLVGLAAGIKLTPLVFVVMLVLVGRRTAAGRAVGAFLVTVAVGFVVLPGTAWVFWSEAISDPGRVGGPAYAGNQSVYGALARLLDGEPPRVLWVAVAGVLAVGVLVVAARVWRSGDRVLGTGLAGLSMLVASPISWTHHWVWALLVGVALVARSWRWGLAWAAVFVAAPGWWFPHGAEREHDWGLAAHVVGNAYLLAALVVAAWAAWWVRPGSGGRGRDAVTGVDREHALDGA
nr:glycosyltransferase 87 family protein [Nocardioides thalensis]